MAQPATVTAATTTCHLAMLCDERAFPLEARKVMARLSSGWTVEEGEGKPAAERLEHEFGHVLIWQAMLACDDPKNPRRELLRSFERVVTPAQMVGAYYGRLGFRRDEGTGSWSLDL